MPPADEFPTPSANGHHPAADRPTSPDRSTVPFGAPADPFEAWAMGDAGGRYRPTGLHRTGGLGEVYRADDPVVGRQVALKRLRPERTGAGLRARFVREAEITGRLEHPNIVPLYDLIAGADGPAYVMRFVAGENLAEAARGYHRRRAKGLAGPLELPRLLGAVVLVCEAVGYAHSKGVLHRDLKGQNVLLGDFGQVCLADWGLAKRIDEPDRPGDPSPLSPPLDGATEPGAVLGTPAFMAPELARGDPASPASDVYGLGAVLYQVLTDRVPHSGTTPEDILSKLTAGEMVPPARVVNPGVHPALNAVCQKALSRAAGDRYPSAGALADDLRAYLAGEPVGAYPEPLRVRAGRWVRRHQAWVAGGVAAVFVAAVGAGVGAWLLYREKERTAAQERQAVANLNVSLVVAEQLFGLVNAYETGAAVGGVGNRRKYLDEAVRAYEQLAAALPDDPVHRDRLAKLLRFLGNLARLTNEPEAAGRAYEASAGVQQGMIELRPADAWRRVDLALTREDEASLRLTAGRPADAVALLDLGAALLTGLPADDPSANRARGMILLLRAAAATQLGRFDPAEAAAREAADLFAGLAAHPAARPHDPILRGLALVHLAAARREKVRFHGGDLAAARAANDEAVDVLRAAAGPGAHPDARGNLYRALVERVRTRLAAGDRPADALPELDAAVDGWAALRDRDPGLPHYRQYHATALTVRGRVRGSAADAAAAVALLEPLQVSAKERPDYRADLSAAWAVAARLAADRAEAQTAYRNAGSMARGAVKSGPDSVLHPRALDELTREAKAAGYDVGAPKAAAKP